ncbi:glycosyltransferase [Caulobacter sp.]|uniref:glycosyltransferase family protein n=1 Tax=Caulobacter sp. TaxID=78 RepID=UPI001B2E822C|nr:glycosyltransferase [Caulobacter sp.]MBO9547362.1 glycosyltransferase family 1 protein [Caulobacter sp.]
MRAVFIKGPSQYDATRLFTDELAAAFTAAGHEAVVIDAVGQADLAATLRAAAEAPTDLVHTYGILGDARGLIGQSLGEIFAAPHVLQHVDYPLSHLTQLEATARETVILTVDPSHVDAIQGTFGPDHFAHVAFCPHAAVGKPTPADADAEVFAEQRPIPILFAGSFYRAETLPWAEEGVGIRQIFDRALDLALGTEFLPALEALDRSLRDYGEDPAHPRYERMRRYATWVHEQVRQLRRQALLELAGQAGLPVFCVGSGYEGWIERHKSFRLGPAMTLSDTVALMARARVVLNANANFGRGSHERPLTAMLAGAAVVTDGAWWTEQFEAGREVLSYKWTRLESDLADLAALVHKPEIAHAIGLAGQARAVAAHRFEHRVDAIIAAAKAA